MVYQPKSSHCIHIDAKAEEKVYAAVRGIVKCYKEVFLQVRHLLFFNESLYITLLIISITSSRGGLVR